METLPKDILMLLAFELGNEELTKLCSANKEIYGKLCGNEEFWRRKINRERPDIIKLLHKFIVTYKISYKELYKMLQGNKVYYYKTEEILVKGDFSKYKDKEGWGPEPFILEGDYISKEWNQKSWKIVREPESYFGYDVEYVSSLEKAMSMLEEEIRDDPSEDEEVIEEYIEEFRENHHVTVDVGDIELEFSIEEVDVY